MAKNRGAAASRNNSPPEVLCISGDRLALVLNQHERVRAKASEWRAPLGLAITLWLAFLVSDFRATWGLKGDQWGVVVFMLASFSTVWLFVELYQRFLISSTEMSLLEKICQNADRQDDHRGIFFFHAEDSSETERVLVYFDIVWKCYLLPSADIASIGFDDPDAVALLAAQVGRLVGAREEDIKVRRVPNAELHSTKYSYYHRREKAYTFEFLHVSVVEPRPEIYEEEFFSGGRLYRWMSVPELLQDENTKDRNSDVLHHIENKFSDFYYHTPPSLPGRIGVPAGAQQ